VLIGLQGRVGVRVAFSVNFELTSGLHKKASFEQVQMRINTIIRIEQSSGCIIIMPSNNIIKIRKKGFGLFQHHEKGELLNKYTIHKVKEGTFGYFYDKENRVEINTQRNKTYSPPLRNLKSFVNLIRELEIEYSFKKL